tara:strand:- start:227 stop:460 length:234 start_codon:yes stop_codon:yes gene_type:complete
MFEKAELVEVLKTRPCTVVFQKANKEIREMHCTLEPHKLPETHGVATAASNPDNVVVFDTDINQWRCFNVTRVISFE